MVRFGPDMQLEERLQKEYKIFCCMNRLTREQGYIPFIGQMKNARHGTKVGLSAGTIKNYISIVARGDRSKEAYVARAATECMQTYADTGHAADIDLETANRLVNEAKKKASQHAPCLWMLLATGGRRIDIHRLKPTSVKLNKHKLVVKFTWTKGIRQIRHRRTVELPLAGLTPPPPGMKKLIEGKAQPFECSVATLNKAIKDLGYKCTTGTFRRLFSRRIEAYCQANGYEKKDFTVAPIEGYG